MEVTEIRIGATGTQSAKSPISAKMRNATPVTPRSQCRKGIEFSCVPYKLCEGGEREFRKCIWRFCPYDPP